MRTCRGCGADLKRHQNVYCGRSCQRATERRAKTEAWLETGQAIITGASRRHYVRLYVFADQQGRCALCNMEATWQGLPLAFVLDHVDGDAANNRRENLRLVCPNCDSQLPTFKARNRGKGRAWRKQRYADGKSY